jgi:hypothetical protein
MPNLDWIDNAEMLLVSSLDATRERVRRVSAASEESENLEDF